MKVVKFAYYDEFHCIGPECTDSCCKNWSIILTKREYLNYKKMDCSPELKSVINTAFTRLRGDDVRYAKMKLNENGDCPFLDEDCLCKLQKEKGEQVLTFVCSIFPRQISQVENEAYIYTCDTTCSYVAELLMNHPEGLALIEEDYKGDNPCIEKGLFSGPVINTTWEGYPYFWTIKGAQTDILQNRNFTIPERMLILGYFCQKAEEYLKSGQGEKIQTLSDLLLDNNMCRNVADSLKAPQSGESAAAKSVDLFVKMMIEMSKNPNSITYKHFQEASDKIGLNIELKESNEYIFNYDSKKYSKNLDTYLKIVDERPYIIENLLVNSAFAQDLSGGIWLNYFTLAVYYNTLKICIPAFLNEEWTDKELSVAISYSSKMVLNTHAADKGISANFMDNNSFDLPHAAFLIS